MNKAQTSPELCERPNELGRSSVTQTLTREGHRTRHKVQVDKGILRSVLTNVQHGPLVLYRSYLVCCFSSSVRACKLRINRKRPEKRQKRFLWGFGVRWSLFWGLIKDDTCHNGRVGTHQDGTEKYLATKCSAVPYLRPLPFSENEVFRRR
jgi:hypothetical protein